MILYFGNMRLIAYKYRKPMKSSHIGMLWVQSEIYIDKQKIECHFDTRHGNNIYFEYKNIYYRMVIDGEYYDEVKGVCQYSINPLKSKREFLTKNLMATGEIFYLSH